MAVSRWTTMLEMDDKTFTGNKTGWKCVGSDVLLGVFMGIYCSMLPIGHDNDALPIRDLGT